MSVTSAPTADKLPPTQPNPLTTGPDKTLGSAPDDTVGRLAQTQPAEEFGLTDFLDDLVDRLGADVVEPVLDGIDGRASIRITGEKVEFNGVTTRKVVPLRHVQSIEVSSPSRLATKVVPHLNKLLMLLPAARLGRALKFGSTALGLLDRRERELVDVEELDRPTIVSLKRHGRTLKLKGSPALVAMLHPRMTQRLLEEAERHGIPVVARR